MNREALIEHGAESLWRAEIRRTLRKDRSIAWSEVLEADKAKYRTSFCEALTAITEAGMVVVPEEFIQGAYNAGFNQGMDEERTLKGGITWHSDDCWVKNKLADYKAMLAAAEKGE